MFTFPVSFFADQDNIDPTALAYIQLVESADGQSLEPEVKAAINDFVTGCKANNIWTLMKACCLLCGPRTLSGALTPIQGPAPTGSNLSSGDYSRKTGIKGNGISKSINTNLANNAMPLANIHTCVYLSESETTLTSRLINVPVAPFTGIGRDTASPPNTWYAHDVGSGVIRFTDSGLGFKGVSRNNSGSFDRRTSGSTTSVSRNASNVSPGATTFAVLSAGDGTGFSDGRISFYSIGNSLNLAILDTLVTEYVNAVASVLP